MANVPPMGPPPSPKEPRRSGRRSVPSHSSSKSPVPSPHPESAPRLKENRPALPSSSSSRSKRSKQEEVDESLEDVPKPPTNHQNGGRNKRKPKDKQSTPTPASIDDNHTQKDARVSEEPADTSAQEEEGITRCICGNAEDEPDTGEVMVQCDICRVWQHITCMGIEAPPDDADYFCEQCRPDLHPNLPRRLPKKPRDRHPSANSHHSSGQAHSVPRSSRSHSPMANTKPSKRRNTMNSRDAAYEESVKALIAATAAEASVPPPSSSMNGRDTAEVEEDVESGLGNQRRKRKRPDDDSLSVKRTRSGSTASEIPTMPHLPGEEPVASTSIPKPTPSVVARPRQKRGGGRKTAQVTDLGGSGDADEVLPPKRQSRAKGGNEGRRGGHNNTKIDAGSASHPRAHHNLHTYAVAQQPLYTSWGLPDYLAHLEPMLPTDIPRPLEIHASKDFADISTERGVKVKWPSKRTSIGDMNKRVRALVEWVGREQASALERGRRKEALTKVLTTTQAKQRHQPALDNDAMVTQDQPLTESPVGEKPTPSLSLSFEPDSSPPPTMKMMEELMTELISFQERFGPGAKNKERERRVVS